MDPKTIDLDSARESAGREILNLVDRIGFPTQAAGWIYAVDPETTAGRWNYYLITPMLDEKGPHWIYERLLKVFSRIGLPAGITPLDIHVGIPTDRLYLVLSRLITVIEAPFHVVNGAIGDETIVCRAYFYRINKEPISVKPRLFDRRVQQLLAA
ncbi:conserved hypothetical protein [uncultured Gammaproteobacteria bacterium]